MKFVKSSLLVKLIILIVVVYATVTLVSLRRQISAKQAEAAQLTSSITSAEQENSRLNDAIETIDTDAGVEAVAREKLGMVAEGEIVFEDVSD
ncbi:MAG: septum formation initiator family protein [Clostridiales bacterium]|nr:septum formation initiator family protein [Clostridiales bacterium]